MITSSMLLGLVTSLVLTSSCCALLVIDLTHRLKIGEDAGGPLHPAYNFTINHRGHSDIVKGWLEFNSFNMGEHRGTHMDAPAHFVKGHWRMHQVPANRLVGPGVVIDVTRQVNGNSDYAMTVDDIKKWEAENGQIPNGAVVIMKTGWDSRYPDVRRIFDTNTPLDSSTFHYPGLSAEAATFLAEERVIIAFGLDSPSPDPPSIDGFPVHMTLLSNNILILENVANTGSLPPVGTTIVLGALNIWDGSGAPMRVLALADLNCGTWGSSGAERGAPLTVGVALSVVVAVLVGMVN